MADKEEESMANNRTLLVIDPNDAESYGRLRQSLDSFVATSLLQYGLILTGDGRTKFSDQVSAFVKGFCEKLDSDFGKTWTKRVKKKIFRKFCQSISIDDERRGQVNCPPGFEDDGFGHCIPIGGSRVPKKNIKPKLSTDS